jgi:hypothetical protein
MIMQLSDIISSIAIIVSVFVFIKQSRYEKIQNELNKMQIDDINKAKEESQRANISAKVVKMGEKKQLIRISNIGAVKAENIDIIFPEDFSWTIFDKQRLPFPFLDPGNNFDLLFATYLSCEREYNVKIKWKENDKPMEKDIILTR